jgi:outer membrane protein OmpA-like peptidoglycan-associated protein
MKPRWTLIGAGLCATLLAAQGCATKGYVREQVGDLQREMMASDEELSGRIDQTEGGLASATSNAVDARKQAEAAREYALGRVDLERAERFQIYFAFNSADLDAQARAMLDRISGAILAEGHYLVDIYGFADPQGDEAYNLALGQRRAEAVMRYLVERSPGALSRYRAISFGESLLEAERQALGEGATRRQVIVDLLERVAPASETAPLSIR